MRRAARTDANHTLITEAMRWTGASVAHTYQLGGGWPDIAVGIDGLNLLFEIKTEHGQLTGREAEFHATWQGQIAVVRSPEQAIEEIQKWKEIAQCLKSQ